MTKLKSDLSNKLLMLEQRGISRNDFSVESCGNYVNEHKFQFRDIKMPKKTN